MDYTVPGILQARILEWVSFPFYRGSSQPKDRTQVFPGSSASKKICLKCRIPWFDSWVGKMPWRRDRQPTPVFWPGEFHGVFYGVAKNQTRLSNFQCRQEITHLSLIVTWHSFLFCFFFFFKSRRIVEFHKSNNTWFLKHNNFTHFSNLGYETMCDFALFTYFILLWKMKAF